MELVYLGLGSNLGDSTSIIRRAFLAISNISGVQLLKVSPLYQTSPISDIPQGDYINAACALQTILGIQDLFRELKKIETHLGKRPKAKNAPREIDIDILFFGEQFCSTEELQVPHPRWKERLFVLIPLWDLTDEIIYPIDGQGNKVCTSLGELIRAFSNLHNERVLPLNKTVE